jgi:hypothetical protein
VAYRDLQNLLEALKYVGDIEHYVAVLKREAAALDHVLSQVTPVIPLQAQQTLTSTQQQEPLSTSPTAATAAAAVEGAVGAKSATESVHPQQQQAVKPTAQLSPGAKVTVAQPDLQDPAGDSVQLPVSSRASR